MPTPELTRLAKEAVAGAEDSMREFLLRADSEYLDQYRTPEMAAEKYVELAEDAGMESGVDPVMAPPESPAIRRDMVKSLDQGLEQMGEGVVSALEPNDKLKAEVKGVATRGMNQNMLNTQMQPGQPMHSASIAIKEGRHGKAAAVLEQMLRQDDAAVDVRKMSLVARQRTEAMLRTARVVQQEKARQAAVGERLEERADRDRALEEQYNTEAGATRAGEERKRLDLRQTERDADPSYWDYTGTDAMNAVRGMAEAAGLGEESLLRHFGDSSKNLDDLLDLHEAGLLTLSPKVKQHAINQKRQISEISDRRPEARERLPALREQDRSLSENEQILRKHAALLESENPYRNQRAGGGMTTEK